MTTNMAGTLSRKSSALRAYARSSPRGSSSSTPRTECQSTSVRSASTTRKSASHGASHQTQTGTTGCSHKRCGKDARVASAPSAPRFRYVNVTARTSASPGANRPHCFAFHADRASPPRCRSIVRAAKVVAEFLRNFKLAVFHQLRAATHCVTLRNLNRRRNAKTIRKMSALEAPAQSSTFSALAPLACSGNRPRTRHKHEARA